MRALLIINSKASSTQTDSERRVIERLSAGIQLDVVHTTKRGDATDSARLAAEEGIDVVFCLGGDGTANETARGLLYTDTALVSLPGGSTNVFGRSMGFPRDAEEAAAVALRSLAEGQPRSIGVGEVELGEATDLGHERRPFLFHCGGGFDAQVTEQVESRPHLKRRLGHLFFAAAAASTWVASNRASISVECILTNGSRRGPIGRTRFAVASNSDPYSFLASRPLNIAPAATLDAPLVATAVTTLSPIAASRILAGALRPGSTITAAPGVVQVEEVAEIRWRSATPFACQVDGEPLGRWTNVGLRQRPSALRVVLPLPNA